MKKTIFLTLIGLVVVVGLLGGVKGLQIKSMIAQGQQMVPPPTPVTTATVQPDSWSTALTAVGSLEAVQGVTVAAEVTGKVTRIAFEAGHTVARGDLLVQQDIAAETAQLRAAQASLELAQLNLKRARELLPEKVITRADFDSAEAAFKQAAAQVEAIDATIAKKTIRAPFAGRLGLRQVNLGQTLNGGDPIVVLQSMDPIFVNFHLPQQELSLIQRGLTVKLTTDALPGDTLAGTITAINPVVDRSTRNIRVQATVANADERLRPGMFVNVAVELPTVQAVLTIPETAVLHAPYSDSVFLVETTPAEGGTGSGRVVRQQFIRPGEKRGDFIAVTSGLKAGDVVVSTGVFKLHNGQTVVVDNTLAPEFKLNPQPAEG